MTAGLRAREWCNRMSFSYVRVVECAPTGRKGIAGDITNPAVRELVRALARRGIDDASWSAEAVRVVDGEVFLAVSQRGAPRGPALVDPRRQFIEAMTDAFGGRFVSDGETWTILPDEGPSMPRPPARPNRRRSRGEVRRRP